MTVDLYLKWKGLFGAEDVFFELKHNLCKKAQLDRLVGIIALTGEQNSALVGRMRDQFADFLNQNELQWSVLDSNCGVR